MNKTIVFAVTVILVAVFVVTVVIQNKEKSLAQGLERELEQTRIMMEATAQTTGLAQVDAIADSIIKDCTVRDRYETLLGKLNTLTPDELADVQQLHAQCSQYYPAQKALLVNRLKMQFTQYEMLTALLSEVHTTKNETLQLDDWRSLITKEETRSELLRKQHDIQGLIISTLILKNTDELKVLVDEAKKVADSLNLVSVQINTEREALLSI